MDYRGELVTDYWKDVFLENTSDKGNVNTRAVHAPAAELESLRDELLDRIDELEDNPTQFYDGDFFDEDDVKGLPDEQMIPRDLSHQLVALFAISCGIMERQLEILLTQEIVSEEERDGLIADYFEERGFADNLELAYSAGLIEHPVYSDADNVRDMRNDLVHDPIFRLTIESYSAYRHKIKKAARAPDPIHDRILEAVE